MLMAKHFVDRIKTALQRVCGLRIDLDNSELQPNALVGRTTVDGQYVYRFSRALHAGWYMLHVNGVKDTLGHDFQLSAEQGDTIHLQVGAKATTKRIMRLTERTSSFGLAILPGPAHPDQFNVSLVRISGRFAVSRMFRKLATSNGVVGRRYSGLTPKQLNNSADKLYADYAGLMQRHVQRVDYQEWLQIMSPDLAARENKGEPITGSRPDSVHRNVTPLVEQSTKPSVMFLMIGATADEVTAIRNSIADKYRSRIRVAELTDKVDSAQQSLLLAGNADYVVAVGSGVILNSVLVPELMRLM